MELTENVIEFISGTHTVTVTFSNRPHITKLKKLYLQHPEDFLYFVENPDGSICAKLPLKWLKISYPKQISDEQRQNASERFKKLRLEGKLK